MPLDTLVVIRLSSEFGPPLWFLGEPKSLKLILNVENPGPVELDFKDLNEQEQQYILNSVTKGHLDCSHTPDELLNLHLSMFAPKVEQQVVELEAEEPVVQDLIPVQEVVEQVREPKRQVPHAIKSLLKKPVSSIKESLKGSKDIKFLKTLLKEELVSKKVRPSVVSFLEMTIKKLEGEVIIAIEQSSKQNPIKIPTKYMKKEMYDDQIMESDDELVELALSTKST